MSFKKQLLSLFTVFTLALGSIAGCGSSDDSSIDSSKEDLLSASPLGSMAVTATYGENSSDSGESGDSNKAGLDGYTITGADYLMIYNPLIYSENEISDTSGKTTGAMGSQINTDLNRAGGLEDFEVPTLYTQSGSLPLQLSEGTEIKKAGGLDPVYSVGDKHDFYIFDINMTNRIKVNFECVYEGNTCYLWDAANLVSASDAELLANEIDGKIFDADNNAFGAGRFLQNGGKLNVLLYPVQPDNLLGFFCNNDIYATGEATDAEVEAYGLNLDHAIININTAAFAGTITNCGSTIAHEYQHQICASDSFENTNFAFVNKWLNEAMSAYAEELVYPNSKYEGHYHDCFYLSNNFRCGQSLYNFDCATDEYIGSYGAVFLFEEYLRNNGGADVFSNVHKAWRGSADTVATALASAVTPEFYEAVNSSVSYPASISQAFTSPDEEWLSKLTLQYFIDTSNAANYGYPDNVPDVLNVTCYDEINAATIQGGGRILVSPVGGSYTIPSDADSDLIYVSFDSNGICNGVYSEDGTSLNDGAAVGTGSQPTTSGAGFETSGSSDAKILTLGSKNADALGAADGIVDGILGSGANKEYAEYDSAKDLASAILADAESSCGMIIVYLNDTSYSASGLSMAVQQAYNNGVPVILINSITPTSAYPWLLTYNYTGVANNLSEFGAYGYDALYQFGNEEISKYVSEAIAQGQCCTLTH